MAADILNADITSEQFQKLFTDKNCSSMAACRWIKGDDRQPLLQAMRERLWNNRRDVMKLLTLFDPANLSSILCKTNINVTISLQFLVDNFDDLYALSVKGGGIFTATNIASIFHNKLVNNFIPDAQRALFILSDKQKILRDIADVIDASTVSARLKEKPLYQIEKVIDDITEEVEIILCDHDREADDASKEEVFRELFSGKCCLKMLSPTNRHGGDTALSAVRDILWQEYQPTRIILSLFTPDNMSTILASAGNGLIKGILDLATSISSIEKITIKGGGIFTVGNIVSILNKSGQNVGQAIIGLVKGYDILAKMEVRQGGIFTAQNISSMLSASGKHTEISIAALDAKYDVLKAMTWRYGGVFTANNFSTMLAGSGKNLGMVVDVITSEENRSKFDIITTAIDSSYVANQISKATLNNKQTCIDEMYEAALSHGAGSYTVLSGDNLTVESKHKAQRDNAERS